MTAFCKRDGWWIYLTGGGYGSLCLTHVGERPVFSLLMYVVHGLRVFLLVMDEGAAVRAGPAITKIMYFNISTSVLLSPALITFVRMFSGVTSPVVDQIV